MSLITNNYCHSCNPKYRRIHVHRIQLITPITDSTPETGNDVIASVDDVFVRARVPHIQYGVHSWDGQGRREFETKTFTLFIQTRFEGSGIRAVLEGIQVCIGG